MVGPLLVLRPTLLLLPPRAFLKNVVRLISAVLIDNGNETKKHNVNLRQQLSDYYRYCSDSCCCSYQMYRRRRKSKQATRSAG